MIRFTLANTVWIAAPVVLWLAGCAGNNVVAPVAGEAPPARLAAVVVKGSAATIHRVVKGDTLYSIAFQHGLDYREIARWNRIADPYLIIVGQRLRLTPPARAAASKASTTDQTARPATSTTARTGQPAPRKTKPQAPRSAAALRWQWPTQGRLIKRFNAKRLGKKGIMIAGNPGQPVVAAAAGKVVYAGSGLVGYGRLVIIKHARQFLSAYAHNRKLLVKEDDRVRRGQIIAQMGSTGTSRPSLHFEIRQRGKPIDPLPLLPQRAR